MNKIIITTPSYNPSIGGAITLHRLCDILNDIGYDAYLTTTLKLNGQTEYFILNDKYNTKIATEIDIENDIIIYPEIEPGNPFECKNVVRYILNKFHLPEYDNTISTWGGKDYWLYYHDLFYDNLKDKNILTILDSKLDLFKDYKIDRNIESCHTYRKRSHERDIIVPIHPQDSIEIGFNTPDDTLIEIFNKCKRFYSYDTETYLSTLAALCGCESVIVPNTNIPAEEILHRRMTLGITYGVAYGIDDIDNAKQTQHLLRSHFENQEKQQYIYTKLEFEKIFKYFNL
jgi:hypothetical protein